LALAIGEPPIYPYRHKREEKATPAFVAFVILGLAAATVTQAFVVKPYSIVAGAMAPNLVRGDTIVVSKFAYGWSRYSLPFGLPLFQGRVGGRAAERGDLAVFKLPRDGATSYANRIIGLPGDRVELSSGRLVVNGRAYRYQLLPQTKAESLRGVRRAFEQSPEGRRYLVYLKDCPPADRPQTFVAPPGYYFLLGDDRDDSLDSRFNRTIGVGFVPEENLEGRVELISTSWTERASIADIASWFSEARFDRFFTRPI
jgi:signal peptidase I